MRAFSGAESGAGGSRSRPIVLTGPSASGKSLVSEHLRTRSIETFELSAAIPKYVAPETPFQERLTRLTELYERTQGSVLIEELLPNLRRLTPGYVFAVIGARQVPELTRIQENFGTPLVIGLDAPLEDRFQRSVARGRADGPRTMHDFLRLTYWEFSLGLANIMRTAHYLIYNDSTIESLTAQVAEILDQELSPRDEF